MVRLRIVKIKDKVYFDDDRLREFRNVCNPHDVITYEKYNTADLKLVELAEKKVI